MGIWKYYIFIHLRSALCIVYAYHYGIFVLAICKFEIVTIPTNTCLIPYIFLSPNYGQLYVIDHVFALLRLSGGSVGTHVHGKEHKKENTSAASH